MKATGEGATPLRHGATTRSYADSDLASDSDFRKQRDALRRALREMEALLGQSATALDALTSQPPTGATVRQLDRLRARLEEAVENYLNRNTGLWNSVREQARRIEEESRRAAMAEKRSRHPRDQARIQELSQELTTNLRLERIDAAIKELLDFLSDDEFYAANASTGRRRSLRTLQNAVEKALAK
jgi:recombination DNA repair RAD52 pathway protein